MMLDQISDTIAPHGLAVSGAFLPVSSDVKTLVLLSPSTAFWSVFTDSPENADGLANPIDRWSTRVITALADDMSARPKFPFGGPPYEPFLDWAKQSGRAFASPLGMLVHDTYGMMISYRGALVFDQIIDLPDQTKPSPCETCIDQPCLTACPVSAITKENGYDVATCHAYLDSTAGAACMTQACQIRTSCPVSVAPKREASHNMLHMRAFKGET